MRVDFWQYMLDSQGNPLQEAQVRVYLAGTSEEADIYLDSDFGSVTKSSTFNLQTDKFGFVQFWIGDIWEVEGGYEATQQFKIRWYNNVDNYYEEIDNLYIFTPVLPVDTSDDIEGIPSNKDKNKVISNAQGYRWDTHVDSVVPSASPHGLEPVTFFNLGSVQSKVISNKLGYQMYQIATTSSLTPVDTSAAQFYSTSIGSWTASGGMYYNDITHSLNNYYPFIVVIKNYNDAQMVPKRIKAMSYNITRVWVEDNIASTVVAIG